MSEQNNIAKGLLVGFLSGAVVGGILALLYAPKSGKELRSDIRKKSGEIAADVDEYLKEAQIKARQLINEGKEKSSMLIADAKAKADHLIADAESLMSEARSRVKNEGTKLRSAIQAGVEAYREERTKES